MEGIVYILLYDEDKRILIQHRSSDAPTSPNKWGFFGGAIEKNEAPYEAVNREAFEELGIKLSQPKLILKENFVNNGKNKTGFYFIDKIKDKSKIIMKEGQGMKWILPSEANNLLSRSYVKKALKYIWKKLK